MGFPFLTAFIIFVIWLALRFNKLDRIQKDKQDAFWEKERNANATPARDISNLSYLTIPLDKFPLNFSSDEEVLELENQLKELSTHRLLNLTGITNTDLKATYGVPNFETMSKIGEDFDKLTLLLNKYAKKIIEIDGYEKAIPVLEYAVGIKTDVSESYNLLADCYKNTGNTTKLDFLKDQIEASNLTLKDSILTHIAG